ncbi:MAG: selenocysteine-specific translation elongation factor [Rhodospirillaceae bacterium]|jgi:selenocysteine-specific elongation factor
MIVATAGHIDHGKTLLVKALTGVETDRLPDEKRRGLTIDLGFAYQDIGQKDILGFVDVPGHEKFVRNMLAGVTNIDFALLIVAADDGVMPQTIEHLEILNLLGINNGAIVITKIDRVEKNRVNEVDDEIEQLLQGSTLQNAPVFYVSALTGDGIETLKSYLYEAAETTEQRQSKGHFRLAVDRCFTLSGAGLVITGSVFSGEVHNGDQLIVSPHGMPARVRSLHAQNQESDTGHAGQRCALNITGRDLKKSAVQRGDWIVSKPAHIPSDRIDVYVKVLAGESKPIRHWTPVHIHIGAADISGRVAILEGGSIPSGGTGYAQLVLDEKTNVLFGDRFILRDQSARRTIGGGYILDPFAPKRGRARPERLEQLLAMDDKDPKTALVKLLEVSPKSIQVNQFLAARGITEAEENIITEPADTVIFGSDENRFAASKNHWDELGEEINAVLKKWHKERPESPGLTVEQIRKRLSIRQIAGALEAAIETRVAEKHLTRHSELISVAGHRPAIPPQEEALWKRVQPILEEAGIRPPTVRELANVLDMKPDQLQKFLDRTARRGLVQSVAKNRYFTLNALNELGSMAQELSEANNGGAFNAAAFRDRSGIGRNLTIELLEHFDKVKLTKRQGDLRTVVQPVDKIFPTPTETP